MTLTDRISVLRAEYRSDSAFVATPRPRLSWVAETSRAEWSQAAAELRLDGATTVRVAGEAHTFVAWPFPELADDLPHTVEVRTLSTAGEWSDWSAPVDVRLAVVDAWAAPFVGLAEPERPAQPVLLRRSVEISEGLTAAVLHVAAYGAATVAIDGAEVDDAVLAPGWTSFDERVLHDSIDVLPQFQDAGAHTMDVTLVGAWYTEEYGFGPVGTRVYGEQPAFAAELHLRYADGRVDIVRTGEEWDATGHGRIVDSGIYAGETQDHTRAPDEGAWTPAAILHSGIVPEARISEPVRRIAEIAPVAIERVSADVHRIDFGQNLVGRLRLHAHGPAGHRLDVRHAEVLEGDQLALRPLRRAAATDTYILSGEESALEPVGTFHGFRYAEITGWPGDLDPDAVRAVVLHSDMRRTGWFESSHPLLNRLHENVVWSMRGNFLSVPTDCPQRDERMGWTGDAQVFAPTAATLFDSSGFLASWLRDLSIEQARHRGVVPFVVPDVLRFPAGPNAAWGDAATVIPSVLFDRFVDDDVVAAQLPSMTAWVDAILPQLDADGLWEDRMQLGDWLDPDAPPEIPGLAKTPSGLVATAYLFRSADLVAIALDRHGEPARAATYRAIADRTRDVFCRAYVTPMGRMSSDSPTAYALALAFGIVTDPELRQKLGDRLAHISRRNGFHISTGFIGTPLILDALVDTGHADIAERLLLQTGYPSWLYPVTMGSTTVWERWDSMLPDGTINPGEMTSFNHYAFGAVVDWMYRSLAGIAPAEPGYRRIRFAPTVLRGLDHAEATVDTASGRVRGGWERVDGSVRLHLTVPAHSTADVHLPDRTVVSAGPGEHTWTLMDAPASSVVKEFSLGSSFRTVADDPEALVILQRIVGEQETSVADILRRRTDWNIQDPIPAGWFDVPPQMLGQLAQQLGALSSVRQQE
ncbi:alpha-L-rhamnosidase [Microbacterium paludicola]|uniref:alpha-L-rhamnosidase n=1 Tax=Microbacterium paludicola TaxID=300019 RepID=A0A4Y9FLB0_9MICO|nr:alpha-L-rhamnosidase [Microbacterium paludicola]MBF0817770.1 family 78 glycoside hydrolase catalytic domain [Microbacterium paludicola]TFU29911.1 alpha-L-rhamnosidase [Microbacterium paludicola]